MTPLSSFLVCVCFCTQVDQTQQRSNLRWHIVVYNFTIACLLKTVLRRCNIIWGNKQLMTTIVSGWVADAIEHLWSSVGKLSNTLVTCVSCDILSDWCNIIRRSACYGQCSSQILGFSQGVTFTLQVEAATTSSSQLVCFFYPCIWDIKSVLHCHKRQGSPWNILVFWLVQIGV